MDRFSKSNKIRIFIKIRPVLAEFSHGDGQTNRRKGRQADMTQIIVALRSFANAPKMKEPLGFVCKARASAAVCRLTEDDAVSCLRCVKSEFQ
jgi:hypothetical protein